MAQRTSAPLGSPGSNALDALGPAARDWFSTTFGQPTPVQALAWPVIAGGEHTLLVAPTGSGKTLAAFLAALDRLTRLPSDAPAGTRVVYVSPLKALVADIERNLRAPLVGLAAAAAARSLPHRSVTVDVRTGDTPEAERRRQRRTPADVLVTTPESLYLLLTSGAREHLRWVDTLIVDEIHVMTASKRGVHLALTLERLAELCVRPPQRVGLSATQRPLDVAARFLGGALPVRILDAAGPPRLSLQVVVTIPDMENPPPAPLKPAPASLGPTLPPAMGSSTPLQSGIWPHIHPRLVALVRAHRSTLLFVNSRLLCERLVVAINEEAGEPLAQAHHGSLSHGRRAEIEGALKAGALRCIVATSSLELGIDMGAIELVILVESPGTVASGLQRVGRAGHRIDAVSEARIFPKFRADLVECAVIAGRMLRGELETVQSPRACLDVLAQQVVALVAERPRTVDEIAALVARTSAYHDLPRAQLHGVLDMLSGRYPSDAFADLVPALVWDREHDVLTARKGARLLAVLNGGTIPDRGLYPVHLGALGPRVGELDEEMVFESRVGDVVVLGASSWRIEAITRDRVAVAPAPGAPGRLPFWRGERPGRPVELGRAVGAFVREVAARTPDAAVAWVQAASPLDALAAANVVAYVHAQRDATVDVPSDRTIVVERFLDELGDWRVCVLSPFGARVHRPWALALQVRLSRRAGFEIPVFASDEGLALRVSDVDALPGLEALLLEPEEVEDRVVEALASAPLFAGRFREAAARALLLPRRRAKGRQPLWMQRKRASALLAVASQHPAFPIVLEAYRECLQDVFDMPALLDLLAAVRRGEVRVVQVQTAHASPFARDLAFQFVAAYLYDGDAPSAERRAQALSLDRAMLRELLGQDALADLLDEDAIRTVEQQLQYLSPERAVGHADALHDLLRRVGDLDVEEIAARASTPAAPLLASLAGARRVVEVRVGGALRWIAAEDAARYRDALGVRIPDDLPTALLDPVPDALVALLARFAAHRGPFTAAEAAARFGLPPGAVDAGLGSLEAAGTLLRGTFRTGGGEALCSEDVLRRIRQVALARARNAVASVPPEAYARFLLGWHGLPRREGGLARLREVLSRLEGLPLPVSVLEQGILAARVADYHPMLLDQLGAHGEIVWVGVRRLGAADGEVALYERGRAPLFLQPPTSAPVGPVHRAVLDRLEQRGPAFLVELQQAAPGAPLDALTDALWDLVWSGAITNDTFQPLRALARGSSKRGRAEIAGGRWSAVRSLLGEVASPEVRGEARAVALVERHGILTRDSLRAEEVPGGFTALLPALRALESAGKVRRGWFVAGLGGSQFALPGAIERLRSAQDAQPPPVVLECTDPANPWGGVLPWPEAVLAGAHPRREPGARVVLVEGRAAVWIARSNQSAVIFRWAVEEGALERVTSCLRAGLGYRTLRWARLDGVPASTHAAFSALRQCGWTQDGVGLALARTS